MQPAAPWQHLSVPCEFMPFCELAHITYCHGHVYIQFLSSLKSCPASSCTVVITLWLLTLSTGHMVQQKIRHCCHCSQPGHVSFHQCKVCIILHAPTVQPAAPWQHLSVPCEFMPFCELAHITYCHGHVYIQFLSSLKSCPASSCTVVITLWVLTLSTGHMVQQKNRH